MSLSVLIKTILPTGKLRAKLEGIDIPVGFRLPELEMVLKDAAEVTTIMRSPPPPTEGRTRSGESIGILPDALVYNTSLPQLFKFSYFCEVEDVPLEILPECIWALEWFIRALTDGLELQLRTFGHILPHQSANQARYFMSSNVQFKAASHLLNKLTGARKTFGNIATPSRSDGPRPGTALARSRMDDDKAKETLSRIFNDKNIDKGSQGMMFLVKSETYLSRVLRRLGEEQDAPSHAKSRQRKFKVVGAGVYKLDDVSQDVEAAMDLNIEGEGKKYMKEMFEEFDHHLRKDILPMSNLMFGAGGIQTYLGILGISKAQMEG
ncbi:hypothetical protein C8J55DRAFT_564866 [Lentinula edodes]|uniref:Uncharacterized protein n=1 Tax=Lentinula lateritia TaxID=40482 RepID=A0A9W8ZVV3_9AGAR|nr:hypothetical protein C8J55DRAFT_564866 [Lentinula edodes]